MSRTGRRAVTASAPSTGGGRRVWWLAGALALAVAVLGVVVIGVSGGDDEGQEFRIEVPPGTWERIRAGEEVELIPRRLELQTGDRLVIVNNDAEAHQVGPYVVPSGETLTQDYPDPGVISQGICTLHPDGRVEIVITERA
ncbi:MAG: hypothetical protein KDB21_20500 [Acidimicrobiales bacterium]|nr:hypothetical protein [Acidimicrobiales bacterium]